MIDPSILTSESIAALSLPAQMHFVRLILVADDQGRFDARPRAIWRSAWAFQPKITAMLVETWTAELVDQNIIQLYTADDQTLGYFPKWAKYQRLRHETKSKFPDPPQVLDTPHVTTGSPQQVRGELPQVAADGGELPQVAALGLGLGLSESVEGTERETASPQPQSSVVDEVPFESIESTDDDPEWMHNLRTLEGYPADRKKDDALIAWAVRNKVSEFVLSATAIALKSNLIWVPPKKWWEYNGRRYRDIRATFQHWVNQRVERGSGNGRTHANGGQPAGGYDPGDSVRRIRAAHEKADREAAGLSDHDARRTLGL